MTGANATSQGYYKPSKKQEVQVETWNQGTTGDQVLSEVHSIITMMPALPTSHQRSGTGFQDGSQVYG